MNKVKMQASPDDGAADGGVGTTDEVVEPTQFEDLFEDASGDDVFSDLSKDEEDEEKSGPPEASEQPSIDTPPSVAQPEGVDQPAAPIQPAVPPIAEATPPPAQPITPAPEPVAPAAPVTPPVQQPSLDELRQQAQAELTARYTLSKEDADAMVSEPEVVLPKLMSQVYLDVYDNVMRSMQVFLPQMVQQMNQVTTVQQQGESEFYSAWPRLAEHKQKVSEIGHMYRTMNPTATKEQFIRDVGLHASITLQVPVESPLMQVQQQQQVTPPAGDVTPPYVPPRGGPVVPSTPNGRRPMNQFEELTEKWGEDY